MNQIKRIVRSTLCLIVTGVLSFLCLIGAGQSFAAYECRAGEQNEYVEEAELLREALRKRQENIEMEVLFSSGVTAAEAERFSQQLFERAVEHTGQAAEGDALYLEIEKIRRGSSYIGRSASGEYRYRFIYQPVYYSDALQEERTQERIAEITASFHMEGMRDYEKIAGIYAWICQNVRYGENGSAGYSAYGAALSGQCLCQGYALLLYRMALAAGLDCRVITSASHAWNLVRIDGIYYHADAAWDAGKDERDYGFFLRSEKGIRTADTEKNEHLQEEVFDREKYPVSEMDYPLINSDRIIPGPPDLFRAKCVEMDQIRIEWIPVDGAEGYEIQRKISEGLWALAKRIDDGRTDAWIDPQVGIGEKGVYRIRAFSGEKAGAFSDEVSILQGFYPAADLETVTGGHKNQVKLSWQKREKADGYEIFRRRPAGSWKRLARVTDPSCTSYTDGSVTEGRRYDYRIRAYAQTKNGKIVSGFAKAKTVLTGLLKPKVSVRLENGVPVIAWNKQKGISGFRVYRKRTGENGWKKIADCKGKILSYTDAGAPVGKNVFYTVRAYKKPDPAESMTKTLWSPWDTKGVKIRREL